MMTPLRPMRSVSAPPRALPTKPEMEKTREQDSHSGHADLEFLREVQGEEWVEHEAAEAVNEHDDVVDPEGLWVFVIYLFKVC